MPARPTPARPIRPRPKYARLCCVPAGTHRPHSLIPASRPCRNIISVFRRGRARAGVRAGGHACSAGRPSGSAAGYDLCSSGWVWSPRLCCRCRGRWFCFARRRAAAPGGPFLAWSGLLSFWPYVASAGFVSPPRTEARWLVVSPASFRSGEHRKRPQVPRCPEISDHMPYRCSPMCLTGGS